MTPTNLPRPHFLLAAATLLFLCGCHIPNRSYRAAPGFPSVVEVSAPPLLPVPHNSPWPTHPQPKCNENELLQTPCLAFLEFDDFGETWQKSSSGRPTQLGNITRLIERARRQDPRGQPLILTFVHGWKHNASSGKRSGDDDSNILGLESVLNQLHQSDYKDHVVIGIYIAWRGGLVSPYWPVSQQFTYWNREAAAIRVGNTSMTEALIEISDATKSDLVCDPDHPCNHIVECARPPLPNSDPSNPSIPSTDTCKPLLLFVGHSFGALTLERAISQAVVTRMEREWQQAYADRERQFSVAKFSTQLQTQSTPPTPNPAPITVEPLASLVIYINSAAAATESKQLMDYLASSHYTYRPANGQDRPLFLSVTSEADFATGFLLKVGHGLPLLGYKFNGSMRLKAPNSGQSDPSHAPSVEYARVCFDPPPDGSLLEPTSSRRYDLSESDYYMTTTAHKEALWSHLVIPPLNETTKPNTKASIEDEAETKALAAIPADPNNPKDANAPYCVLNPNPTETPGQLFSSCRIDQRLYKVIPEPNRCNGTPYWVLQVQKEIIPDHGTIFTERLIAFLRPFIPQAINHSIVIPQLTRPMSTEIQRTQESLDNQ